MGIRKRRPGNREIGENSEFFDPTFRYTGTISLLVTMLIGHFMVFDAIFKICHFVWHLAVLHYIVPVMAILDWLLFEEKMRIPI